MFRDSISTQKVTLPVGTWNLAVVVKDSLGSKVVCSTNNLGGLVGVTIEAPSSSLPSFGLGNLTDALHMGDVDSVIGIINSKITDLTNVCKGMNCGNGQCVVVSGSAVCICNEDFSGNNCEIAPANVDTPVKPCINGCNGNGDCGRFPVDCKIDDDLCVARCFCKVGWYGNDCSIDEATHAESVVAISDILGSLKNTSAIIEITPDTLSQTVDLLKGTVDFGDGFLTAEHLDAITDMTSTVLSGSESLPDALPTTTADDLVGIVETILASEAGSASSSRRRMLAKSVNVNADSRISLINNITAEVSKKLLPGEPTISFGSGSINVNVLASKPGVSATIGNVTIPEGFLKNMTQNIKIQSITFSSDPHNSKIDGNVTSLNVFCGRNETKVEKLEKPVDIVMKYTNGTVPKCSFWDTVKNAWSSDGLVTKVGANFTVTCSTTHFTDFAIVSDSSIVTIPSTTAPSSTSAPGGGNVATTAASTDGGNNNNNNSNAAPSTSPMMIGGIGAAFGVGMLVLVGYVLTKRMRNASRGVKLESSVATSTSNVALPMKVMIGDGPSDKVVMNPLGKYNLS